MDFTAEQISMWLDGELIGNPNAIVNTLSKIEEGEEGSLSFLSNPAYNHYIYNTEASVVIVNKSFVPEKEVKTTMIKVEDAYNSFAMILTKYDEARKSLKQGISPAAHISESATIGKDVYIGEFVFVGTDVVIGDGARLYPQSYVGDSAKIGKKTILLPGVKVLHECIIGDECTLHEGVIIGSDGFGFAPQVDDDFKKIPQIGNVILENRVDIGANTVIDRATMGSTIIRKGVKLDNLIQIAHNVEIGENTVMAAQGGVSGSTKIGKNCMFGGQVGIAGHLEIADGVKLAATSGVASSIKTPNAVEMGTPSFNHQSFLQSYVYFRKLPKLAERISKLEKSIKEL